MAIYFRILGYTKRYITSIILAVTFSILFSLLNGASVYLAIPLLDALFQDSAAKTEVVTTSLPVQAPSAITDGNFLQKAKDGINAQFQKYIFTGSKIDSLTRICMLVLLIFLLKNIVGYFQAYFLAIVEQGTVKDIRNAAYEHLHQLPISFFKNERTGNLISCITNDVNVMQGSIAASFLNLVREPLSILVFLGMALSISWQLTIFSFVILPVTVGVIAWFGLKIRRHITFIQEKMADITNVLQETISGVKIVKAFGMEKYETNKFFRETKNYFNLMMRITRIRNLAQPVTEFLSVVVGAVIIYKGGRMVLEEHTLKASEFLGFLFAIFQMMPPLKELSSVNNRIQEAAAAGARVFAIIDTPPSIVNVESPKPLTKFSDKISFNAVQYQYEDADEPVLQNISFDVQKGEVVALVGPSGGGKSTLVDLIPRFYDVTGGSITVDGVDIRDYEIAGLRGLMGIVTQETILFNESIKQNIAYGLSEMPMDRIVRATKMANAHDFIEELPDGYNTQIGERGVKLSGGQRQRLSIARALLKDPQIMIFDEATSALDNESELLVQEAIERLMENRTTFIIAHRLSTIRKASKILVIERGHIVQSGSHDELLADEHGLYKKLYEMQFRDQD
jgi:subfamily B ATP-binding cassette protein MsbA